MPLDPELGGTYNHNAVLKGYEFHTRDGDMIPADAYNQKCQMLLKEICSDDVARKTILPGWVA